MAEAREFPTAPETPDDGEPLVRVEALAKYFDVSPPFLNRVLQGQQRAVLKAVDSALMAVTQKNVAATEVVVSMKAEINRLADSAAMHEAKRLVAEEPNRLPAYTIEMDLLQNLKRIYYFTKRMARVVVARSG